MTSVQTRFNSDFGRQWVNLIAILAAFGINVYANIAPPNGLTIGEISNQFFGNVLIIPANYAFAIWGIIYLGLISFGIYQALPAQREDAYLRRSGYFIAIASLAQIVWVFVFLSQWFVLSVVAMVVILLELMGIYLSLDIARARVSRVQKWLVQIPLSIYFAWISVATIVNVAIALDSIGWDGGGIGAAIWTAILLLIGAAIAATLRVQRDDIVYPIVFIWAYVAIAVRNAAQPLVAATAILLAIILGLLILLGASRPSGAQSR